MKVRLNLLFLFSSLFFSLVSVAQQQVGLESVEITENAPIDLKAIEEKAFSLLNARADSEKIRINSELKNLLRREINKPEAIHHSFQGLESIAILMPADSSFKLFNWNIPWENGTYSYECGILYPIKGQYTFQFLAAAEIEADIESVCTENTRWIPALFYDLIETETTIQSYYSLLAWDGNNRLSNKKIIDVLWFDPSGEPRFGAPIFTGPQGKKMRVVFEYGGQNKMSLNYNPALKRIEFDHLSPPNSSLNGVFEYYGADLSYDGYQWIKNQWKYVPDINIDEGLNKKKQDFKVNKDVIRPDQPIYKPNN